MNYILGNDRSQARIECIEDYVEADNEVRVIDKIIDALTKVFESFVEYCIELGLYGKKLIAVDGTKIKGSASKRNHYSKNKINIMKEYDELEKTLDKNDVNEINFTDKGYFQPSDLKKCEENQIICYVSKPSFYNSTGNSVYFSDKFKYNP